MLSHAVVLQHVEQGRLASIVQAQEEELARLLPEAQVGQDVTEPIPEKHLGENEKLEIEMKVNRDQGYLRDTTIGVSVLNTNKVAHIKRQKYFV